MDKRIKIGAVVAVTDYFRDEHGRKTHLSNRRDKGTLLGYTDDGKARIDGWKGIREWDAGLLTIPSEDLPEYEEKLKQAMDNAKALLDNYIADLQQ